MSVEKIKRYYSDYCLTNVVIAYLAALKEYERYKDYEPLEADTMHPKKEAAWLKLRSAKNGAIGCLASLCEHYMEAEQWSDEDFPITIEEDTAYKAGYGDGWKAALAYLREQGVLTTNDKE